MIILAGRNFISELFHKSSYKTSFFIIYKIFSFGLDLDKENLFDLAKFLKGNENEFKNNDVSGSAINTTEGTCGR